MSRAGSRTVYGLGAALERSWERCLERLQALVRARAEIGNEGPAQRIVADAFAAAGLALDIFEIDPDELGSLPGWGPGEVSYAGRPTVVATRRGTGGGRSLILSAHIDSVVTGPTELWERDPWSGTIADGRLYGRGAWDDKAGVAILTWLADALRDAGIGLRGDLILESVIEEEASGNGSLACAARGYQADAAIVVDGRGPGSAVTDHCGQLWFRLDVRGRSVAAVRSETGRNAVELLLPLVSALRELERRVPSAEAPFDRVERPFKLNLGVLRAGATPTTVPGLATLECHLTFPPPLTLEELKALVTETIERAAGLDPWFRETPPTLRFLSLQVPPFRAVPGTDALLAALDGCQRVELGMPLEVRATAGFGDLRHFQLRRTTPCCFYGSGVGENPHAPNEWLELKSVRQVARVLAPFVVEWCGEA